VSAVLEWRTGLSADDVADIDRLLSRVSDADGVSAISEHAYLHVLAGGGHGDWHGTVRDGGGLVAYAHVSTGPEPVAEFLVDPGARGRGLGGRIADEVLQRTDRAVRIWAHGRLPAAEALAHSRGLSAVRTLCRYTRGLADIPDVPLPEHVRVRPFARDDADDWLALNAAAFADLPDQGSWTRHDLDRRLGASWFDPDGFLLAFDGDGLVGYHWTKVHGGAGHPHAATGEVYVLAVAPRARGTGLGVALTVEGLRHLGERGMSEVMLYVDCENRAAVRLYTGLGFARADCDVQYAAAPIPTHRVPSGSLGA
jgi:mycothiol synthase